MSNSIAHRSHAHHVPLLPVFAVVATVLIATAVIWAINQPQTGTTTTTTTQAIVLPAAQQAAVVAPESPVFRHAKMRADAAGGYPPVYVANVHHLVDGTTLDPVSPQPFTGNYKQPNFPRVGQ